MSLITNPFGSYVVIDLLLIALIGWVLLKAGATFLVEVVGAKQRVAGLLNRVILASFLFANIGFAVMDIPSRMRQTFIENLGSSLLFLGFTLFLGLWIFAQ